MRPSQFYLVSAISIRISWRIDLGLQPVLVFEQSLKSVIMECPSRASANPLA